MKEVISPQIINIVLLTAGALQGILVSVFLAKRKFKDNPPKIILLLLIIIPSVQLLLKVANTLWLLQHLSSWYIISYELPFLYGPLLYLYIRFSVWNSKSYLTKRCWSFNPNKNAYTEIKPILLARCQSPLRLYQPCSLRF